MPCGDIDGAKLFSESMMNKHPWGIQLLFCFVFVFVSFLQYMPKIFIIGVSLEITIWTKQPHLSRAIELSEWNEGNFHTPWLVPTTTCLQSSFTLHPSPQSPNGLLANVFVLFSPIWSKLVQCLWNYVVRNNFIYIMTIPLHIHGPRLFQIKWDLSELTQRLWNNSIRKNFGAQQRCPEGSDGPMAMPLHI